MIQTIVSAPGEVVDDNRLARLISAYGFAASLEVKNGIHRHAQRGLFQQVAYARDYLSSLVDSEYICGGICYVRNRDVDMRVVPSSFDFVLHSQEYSAEELTTAVRLALDGYKHPTSDAYSRQRDILQKILWAHEKRNEPLVHFFNTYDKRYWDKIKSFFPEYSHGGAFKADMEGPRGIILELYVAALLTQSLPEKESEIIVRHSYTHNGHASDIDVLVVTSLNHFVTAVHQLASHNVFSRFSRDFKHTVRRKRRA